MNALAAAEAPGVDVAERYRIALRNVAAAVAVVTTFDADQVPHGTTVSAFTPLSMDPALLLVSLDNRSQLLARVGVGQRLGVNVLGADHAELGRRFAGPADDRWTGVAWASDIGVPALRDRHAFIGIETTQLIPAGDHTLVIGAVIDADWSPGSPLVYWQRGFGTYEDR